MVAGRGRVRVRADMGASVGLRGPWTASLLGRSRRYGIRVPRPIR
ncbi:hypothetical protein STXM2123_1328 [Streptomyces sp. F-3]|nr:hypothetical protein STXM2123_1328 [Streptomyces sp. F-3]